MSSRAGVATLLVGLLLAGCAARETWWTKPGASERQFRAASGRCFDEATDIMADEAGRSQGACVVNSQYGTVCGRLPEEDPYTAERRRERRLQYLWGACMEERGWDANHDGVGYKRS